MPKLGILLTLLIASLALVSTAAATAPVTSHGELQNDYTLIGVCDFPIAVHSTTSRDRIRFYDDSGTPTMFILHDTEQDTFTANGKTLIGEPYNFNWQVLFENGVPTAIHVNGRVQKLILPDGTLLPLGRPHRLARPSRRGLPDHARRGRTHRRHRRLLRLLHRIDAAAFEAVESAQRPTRPKERHEPRCRHAEDA